jgi:pimeloyl-ACP methyl ester carboxylesterase
VRAELARTGERFDVPVAGGDLRVIRWGDGPAKILGLPGATASHIMFWPIAKRLGDGVTFLAPDWRGRGCSAGLPGPYGMRTHVTDVLATLDYFEIPSVTLVGVSMGGRPALIAAAEHPERVDRVVLVDAGLPISLPEGVDLEQFQENLLGPSLERLRMTFPTREAYHEFWRAHPSMQDDWNEDFEAYIDYDLVGDEPNLRSGVNPEAIRDDSIDVYRDPESLERTLTKIRCPVLLLRATRGVLNQPEPLFSEEDVERGRRLIPDFRDEIIDDTNHFTIVFGERPAQVVADRITTAVTE